MQQWVEDLLALQDVDMRIHNMKLRLKAIPGEIKKLEQTIVVEAEDFKSSREGVKKAELDIKHIESEITAQNDHIQKLQKQSVMIKKNDEYKAMLSEVNHHKQKISDFETQEIEAMDALDAAQGKYRELEKQFDARMGSLKDEITELKTLIQEVKEEIESLKQGRNAHSSRIASDTLVKYNRLLQSGRAPLVPVNNSCCGNCHLKLTPNTLNQARKSGVTHCDNCSYMLYLKD
jgi:uncharacterized protein